MFYFLFGWGWTIKPSTRNWVGKKEVQDGRWVHCRPGEFEMDLHQNGSLTLTVQYFKRFNGFQLDFFSRIFFLVLLKVFFFFWKTRTGWVRRMSNRSRQNEEIRSALHTLPSLSVVIILWILRALSHNFKLKNKSRALFLKMFFQLTRQNLKWTFSLRIEWNSNFWRCLDLITNT